MGKKPKHRPKSAKKNKASRGGKSEQSQKYEPNNFIPEAGDGCHIVHFEAPWIIGTEPFDPDDYEPGTRIPDIAISPEDPPMLSVINTTAEPRTFYVSLKHQMADAQGEALQMGWTRDASGTTSPCITFVLVVAPNSFMHVAYVSLPPGASLDEVHEGLDSDVQKLAVHPAPAAFDPAHTFLFPLGGAGPYLCTQGVAGHFTHFFSGSYHAVDFRCPVGTPILAIGNGTIVEVRQSNTVSGIHVQNLFNWNSILLELEVGTFVEYVHIKADSSLVQVGDKVVAGQQLCESGEVGFCPEPHLHIQMHTSKDTSAPTIMFAFRPSQPPAQNDQQLPSKDQRELGIPSDSSPSMSAANPAGLPPDAYIPVAGFNYNAEQGLMCNSHILVTQETNAYSTVGQ